MCVCFLIFFIPPTSATEVCCRWLCCHYLHTVYLLCLSLTHSFPVSRGLGLPARDVPSSPAVQGHCQPSAVRKTLPSLPGARLGKGETRWQVRWKMEFSGRGEGGGGGGWGDTFLFPCFERRKEVKGQTVCFQLVEEKEEKKVTVSGGFSVWPQKWTMRSDEFVFLAFFHFKI